MPLAHSHVAGLQEFEFEFFENFGRGFGGDERGGGEGQHAVGQLVVGCRSTSPTNTWSRNRARALPPTSPLGLLFCAVRWLPCGGPKCWL